MKQVVQQYGAVVIAIFISIAIVSMCNEISIWNRQGVPAILGMILENEIAGTRTEMFTGEAFQQHKNISSPQIVVENPYVYAKETVKVSSYFSAKDDSGRKIPVFVEEILGEDFAVEDAWISADRKEFRITKEGIYWISAKATAASGHSKAILVKIIVKERSN